MTGDHGHLRYGEQVIPYRVVRRPRKTMEIAVEPDASVVIAAPLEASGDPCLPWAGFSSTVA